VGNFWIKMLYRGMWKFSYIAGTLKARLLGVKVGKGTKIALSAKIFYNPLGSIEFGKNCIVFPGVVLAPHGHGSIRFGDNCSINPYCVIYGHGGLVVGNDVRMATQCVLIPANHRFEGSHEPIRLQGLSKKGIRVGDNVWFGAGVRVLDGVEIVSGCVIGAGAVVVSSLSAPGSYVGVPAKMLRRPDSVESNG